MRAAGAGMSGHVGSGSAHRPGYPTGSRRERLYMACQNDPSTCDMGETDQSSCSPYSGISDIGRFQGRRASCRRAVEDDPAWPWSWAVHHSQGAPLVPRHLMSTLDDGEVVGLVEGHSEAVATAAVQQEVEL